MSGITRTMRRAAARARDAAAGVPLPDHGLDKEEPTVAYGARCAWWDAKSRAGKLSSGLPCCPHCHGVLFEAPMSEWWPEAHAYERNGHPGYVPFLRWLKGRCYPSLDAARAAYESEVPV